MTSAGSRLRALREQLGLTLRDAEAGSIVLAARHDNPEFVIQLSRLSDIETKGVVPSVYRLYTLAVLYRIDIRELMQWYGVDLAWVAADMGVVEPPKSHKAQGLLTAPNVRLPIKMDPSFTLARTTNIGRMVERWGTLPLSFLAQFENSSYTYGYIGMEDLTMYPLLLPGSFVQVDESKNRVLAGAWRSEYERPIYFIETRDGFACAWCELEGERLTLQPHPLSPARIRTLKHPQEAEIVGQVVALAMRLGQWRLLAPAREPRALSGPN